MKLSIDPYSELGGAYVPRCSSCGDYGVDLWQHWFFTGCYCRECVQHRLYKDEATIEGVNNAPMNTSDWFFL